MATWAEVQAYARSKHKLIRDEPAWFSLGYVYEDRRAQVVVVALLKTPSREWVEFRSAVCKENEMSPVVALRKNYDFAFGALALLNDMYVFRYSVQLASMDLEELTVPLGLVADIADSLEKTYSAKDVF